MSASKKLKTVKRCVHCDEEYLSNNIRQIYCSGNCNTKHNRMINPEQRSAARKRAKSYYHKRDPLKRFEQKLQSKYGISLNIFEKMKIEQNNLCAICEEPLKLVVDHCHETGKVRNLLCNNCNGGIGFFKENVGVMRNAIKYLEKWK